MSELTHKDLQRAYDKMEAGDAKNEQRTDELRSELNSHISEVSSHLSELSTSTAVMAERFRQMTEKVDDLPDIIPEIPERPCPHFTGHIEDHKTRDLNAKEAIRLWQRPVVSCIIDLVKMGVVFLLAFIWGKNK